MWQVKNAVHKFAMRSLLLAGTTTLLVLLAVVTTAKAQVVINLNPPICSYGYYDYSPYGCAPWAFMGRAISITASSWAWAHGRTGAMAMAGVSIASTVGAEEPTSPPVETAADVLMLAIVESNHQRHAVSAVAAPTAVHPCVAPMPQQFMEARPMVPLTQQQHTAVRLMVLLMPQQRVAHPMAPLMPQERIVADHMEEGDRTAVVATNIVSQSC